MRQLAIFLALAAAMALICRVGASATEDQVTPMQGRTQSMYLVPLVLQDSSFSDPHSGFVYGTTYTLKYTDWSTGYLGPGNLAFISYYASSSTELSDRLALNADEIAVGSGDYVTSATGNKVGLFLQGMEIRLDKSNYTNHDFGQWASDGYPSDSRLCISPVIEDTDISGARSLPILGFVAFYVDDYDATEQDLQVTFVPMPDGSIVAVPEPSALLALGGGLFAIWGFIRRETS